MIHNCCMYVTQDMRSAEIINQRLDRVFQQQDHITIDDLLAEVQSPDELHSNAFRWAVHKLIWRLDSTSQACRDLKDFKLGVGRYGSFPPQPRHVVQHLQDVSPLSLRPGFCMLACL